MSSVINGGKWNRKKYCSGCGYNKDRADFRKKSNVCKECQDKLKISNNITVGETNEETQESQKDNQEV